MKCLVPLNLGNYKDLAKPGKRIISEKGYATIIYNPNYTDGLSIGSQSAAGWSVKAFLEEHDEVYIISEI